MYVVSTSSNEDQPSDLEETINDYNYDNPNDSQNCNPERYDVSTFQTASTILLEKSH